MKDEQKPLERPFGDRSIAVLPFEDLSPEGDHRYLSDGIAEELLNRIARLPEFRVISRSSAFAYRDEDIGLSEIAKRLTVSRIVEGSVRTAGDRVRVFCAFI